MSRRRSSATAPGVEKTNGTSSIKLQPRSTGDTVNSELFKSVVKLFVVKCSPKFSNPWQMSHQRSSRSSGFFFKLSDKYPNCIMCNAHGVVYAKSIRVRKHSDKKAKKWPASILFISNDCDLAILTVEDEKFWKNTKSLEFGTLPELQNIVQTLGYPTGGDNICITKGVVSRIGFTTYSHSSRYLPSIQMDAAINPGSSGGPMLMDNKVIGVSFQHLTNSQNISYAIPNLVIQHFIQDIIKNDKRTHFPFFGVIFQTLESRYHRLSLGMKEDETGVFVRLIKPLSDASVKLKQEDVILSIDGVPIADDATIPLPSYLREKNGELKLLMSSQNEENNDNENNGKDTGERIAFQLLTTMKFSGDYVNVKILRNKQYLNVKVQVSLVPDLIPIHQFDNPYNPSYYMFGGLVFTPLTRQFLKSYYGKNWKSRSPLLLREYTFDKFKEESDRQIIVLSHVLAHPCNIGYENYQVRRLLRINGIEIRNIIHLMEILDYIQNKAKNSKNNNNTSTDDNTSEQQEEKINDEICESDNIIEYSNDFVQPKNISDFNFDKFTRFEFEITTVIVLDTLKSIEAEAKILKSNNIPNMRSKDLQDYVDKTNVTHNSKIEENDKKNENTSVSKTDNGENKPENVSNSENDKVVS